MTSATPGSIGDQTRKEAEFIKYTPNPNAPGFNSNAKQRVVRMVAAQVRHAIVSLVRRKSRGKAQAAVPCFFPCSVQRSLGSKNRAQTSGTLLVAPNAHHRAAFLLLPLLWTPPSPPWLFFVRLAKLPPCRKTPAILGAECTYTYMLWCAGTKP